MTSKRFALPVLFVAASMLGCVDTTAPEPADLVVVGGSVYTSDTARPRAEALAVRDGRLVYVGNDEGARELVGAGTETVELSGETVLPGLIDGHVHLGSGSSLVRGVDLYAVAEKQAWLAMVAEKVAELPDGAWVVGGRWDHTLSSGSLLPTKEDLDTVSAGHPVALSDVDGHSTWVNTRALEIAGVAASTPDPQGGEIVRDPGTGEPTGILFETAGGLVTSHIPALTDEERLRTLRETIRYANSLGLTGVHDMSDYLDLYTELATAGELTLRVWFGKMGVSPEELPRVVEERDALAVRLATVEAREGPLLSVGFLKLVADGVLSTRTAALLAPYADAPSETGLPRYSQEELDELVAAGNAAGFPVAIHAIGDRAVRMSLNAFEASPVPPPLPNRIEHIEVVDPSDAPRFARLGVLASMNPHHCITGIDVYNERRLGPERARWAFAWNQLEAAGAKLVFGSDWATAPLDPLHQLYAAVVREKPSGGPPGGWHPENTLPFEAALAAYTRAPADASGWGDRIGSLETGKWADFVILDGTLTEPVNRTILDRRVRATYLAGRRVYSRPEADE